MITRINVTLTRLPEKEHVMAEQVPIDEKYTYQFDAGSVQVLRNGLYWLDSRDATLTAPNAWIAAAGEIERLRRQIAQREDALLRIHARAREDDTPMNVAADIDQITIEIGDYPTPE